MISKLIKHVADIMMAIAVIALILAVAVNAYEIVGRMVFAKSLLWIQDFTLLCMMWFIFGTDVVVDYFFGKFPPKAKNIIVVFNDIVVAVTCAILFAFSVNLAILRQGKAMSASEIPLIYYTLAMNVSFFLMSVMYFEKFIKRITAYKEGGSCT